MSFDPVSYAMGQKAGSGGGGVSDYSDLTNKPQINGVSLIGNKSAADLLIKELPTVVAADAGKDLTVDPSGQWVAGKSVSWIATVSASFAVQSVTVEIGGSSFTKVSDKAFSAEKLTGASFWMQGESAPITSSMLIDMSSMGVTGTLIDLSDYGMGPVIFSCTEAGNVVSEPGFYLIDDVISYAPFVTISYSETLTAQTRAIGVGDMEMEDGVTDLPTGVLWLQYES